MKQLGTVFLLCLGYSMSGQAAPVCMTGTLTSFLSLGSEGCETGGGTFSNFRTLLPITGAVAIPADQVFITPVIESGSIGLDVSFDATAAPGQLLQALIGYQLSALAINSTSVTVSGVSVSGGAVVTDIQNACAGGQFLPGDVTGCTGTESTLVVLNNGSDMANFAPVSLLDVVHDFTLDAGNGGTASGGMVSDRFAVQVAEEPIPEPSSVLLLSSALIALGFRARKSAAKKSSNASGRAA